MMIEGGFREKEPQINADERRYIPITGFDEIIHRKGRKERKAAQQESLSPLRSLRLNAFSTPAHGRAPQPALHSSGAGDGGWRDDGDRGDAGGVEGGEAGGCYR
ncbi:MAG: hypothetical protein OIN88_10410 [Candidatus Methanoperedens sp.]|nr:hypothetical protein [Candidatus Methanoperedens sp.]